MSEWLCRFWRDDEGQDLIEYSLLITFIAIATMWFVGSGGPAIRGAWTGANSSVNQAAATASGS